MKKKQFFVNFMTIILFGAIGTLISCAVITLGRHYCFTCTYLGCYLRFDAVRK